MSILDKNESYSMRIILLALFSALLTAQPLMAKENCPNLCDFSFWQTATAENVRAAIESGEDVNAVDEYGFPVFNNIMSQSVSEFLEYNPQGDAAAEQQRIDSVIMLMLESGVDIAANEAVGTPYLHLAARNSSLAVVKRMLEAGAALEEVDGDQNSALHRAAEGSNIATMEYLIGAGLGIDIPNEDGETPLHAAAGSTAPRPAKTMLWLIAHGANVNAQANRYQETPIMDFFFWGAEKRIADSYTVLAAAMGAGYDLTLSNNDGNNILHYATWVGRNPEVITYLIAQGADISAQNNEGKTAYDLAMDNYFLAEENAVKALQ